MIALYSKTSLIREVLHLMGELDESVYILEGRIRFFLDTKYYTLQELRDGYFEF